MDWRMRSIRRSPELTASLEAAEEPWRIATPRAVPIMRQTWRSPDVPPNETSLGDELVRRWCESEDRDAAFEEIFKSFYPRLKRFFARRGAAASEIEELAQETSLKVMAGLPTFRSESRFEVWLFQIRSVPQ